MSLKCQKLHFVPVRCNEASIEMSPRGHTSLLMFNLILVKLVGGSSPREGLVQVYYNNTWGSVCDQMWDAKDADVVCRMIGYTGAAEPKKDVDYGRGNGTTWLNNVQCSGNESSLFSCAHDGLRNHTCERGNEVNVSCLGTHGNVNIIISDSFLPQLRLIPYFTGQQTVKTSISCWAGWWPNGQCAGLRI